MGWSGRISNLDEGKILFHSESLIREEVSRRCTRLLHALLTSECAVGSTFTTLPNHRRTQVWPIMLSSVGLLAIGQPVFQSPVLLLLLGLSRHGMEGDCVRPQFTESICQNHVRT